MAEIISYLPYDEKIKIGIEITLRSGGAFEPGFNLGSNLFFFYQSVQPGFELLQEFELFEGSENSILNLGSTWVLIGFHSTWVQPGLYLG